MLATPRLGGLRVISFATPQSAVLLRAFDDAIDQGHVETWERSQGGYYGHSSQQWQHKAFFNAVTEAQSLRFNLTLVDANIAAWEHRAVFAAYHGFLLSSFQRHFYFRFQSVSVSPTPCPGESQII